MESKQHSIYKATEALAQKSSTGKSVRVSKEFSVFPNKSFNVLLVAACAGAVFCFCISVFVAISTFVVSKWGILWVYACGVAFLLCSALFSHKLLTNYQKLHFSNIPEKLRKRFRAFERTNETKLQFTKIFLGTIFLLPWRVILGFIFFFTAGISTLALGTSTNLKKDIAQSSCTQRSLHRFILKFCVQSVLLLSGVWKIEEYIQDGAQRPSVENHKTVVCNHISSFDILVFLQSIAPSFVAKRGVADIPFVGWIAKELGCVFVNRENKELRLKALNLIKERQYDVAACKTVNSLLVFPEGTTSNGKGIIPFKSGVFSSLQPITPVVLVYKFSSFSLALDVIPTVWSMALLLCSINYVTVELYWLNEVCPPLKVSATGEIYSDEDRAEMFSNEVRERMVNVLRKYSQFSSEIPADISEWEGTYRTKMEAIKMLTR